MSEGQGPHFPTSQPEGTSLGKHSREGDQRSTGSSPSGQGQCSHCTKQDCRNPRQGGGHRDKHTQARGPAHYPVGSGWRSRPAALPQHLPPGDSGAVPRAGVQSTRIWPRQGPPLHLGTSRASLASPAPCHYHLHLCCLNCCKLRLLRMEANCLGHSHPYTAAMCN